MDFGTEVKMIIENICKDNRYLLDEPELLDIIQEWEKDRKFYERVLTDAVSLPAGELPAGKDYYCCLMCGNVKVFRR